MPETDGAGDTLRHLSRLLEGVGVEPERIYVDEESRSVLVTEIIEVGLGGGVRRLVISVQILDEGDSVLIAAPLLPFPLNPAELSAVAPDLLRLSLHARLAACGATSDGYAVAFSEVAKVKLSGETLWARYGAVLRALERFLSRVLPKHPELEERLLKGRGEGDED